MLRNVFLPRRRARTMPRRSPRTSVIPALSIATSVPVPIAMPTSAAASAGASLMPSPAIATTRPSRRYLSTTSAFAAGSTSASTSVIPTLRATASAVVLRSPVTITTRTPSACNARSASDADSFTGSATERTPARPPSTARNTTVHPSPQRGSASPSTSLTSTPRSPRNDAFPTATARPSTFAVTPWPGIARNDEAAAGSMPRSRAPSTTARANGCSLPRSTDAASRRTSASPYPPSARTSTRRGFPSVSVPVLSRSSVSTRAVASSASALRTSTPACAPRPVATMMLMGVASPSAHGHAMMSTATAFTSA